LGVDVVIDFAEFGHNPFVAPPFKGAAKVDADDFAEYTGVDSFMVINREHRCTSFRVS
jgi:hypothetical protein